MLYKNEDPSGLFAKTIDFTLEINVKQKEELVEEIYEFNPFEDEIGSEEE